MDTVTLSLIVLIGAFTIHGAWRGLNRQVASFVGMVASLGTIWYAYPAIYRSLFEAWPTTDPRQGVFYAVILTIVLGAIVFITVAKLLACVIKWLVPQPFNAIFGGLIGAIKILLVLSILGGIMMAATERWEAVKAYVNEHPEVAYMVDFWGARFKQLPMTQKVNDSIQGSNDGEF